MILGVVHLPHPPLLMRELGGAQDPVAELRDACARALAEGLAVGPPETVHVVGGAGAAGRWDLDSASEGAGPLRAHGHVPGVDRSGFVPDGPDRPALPTSLAVACRLLQECGWRGPVRLVAVPWTAGAGDVGRAAAEITRPDPGLNRSVQEQRMLLLVMADGGARRGESAPGYLDDRALEHDDAVSAALAAADTAALAGADPRAAVDLLDLGRAARAVLGVVVGDALTARESDVDVQVRSFYEDDPYGVLYRVGCWVIPEAGSR